MRPTIVALLVLGALLAMPGSAVAQPCQPNCLVAAGTSGTAVDATALALGVAFLALGLALLIWSRWRQVASEPGR